jgi:hypothetical protein
VKTIKNPMFAAFVLAIPLAACGQPATKADDEAIQASDAEPTDAAEDAMKAAEEKTDTAVEAVDDADDSKE